MSSYFSFGILQASEGRVSSALLESMMADHREYLHRKPPKSTGREVSEAICHHGVCSAVVRLNCRYC